MKDFLNKTWVVVVGWIGLIISSVLLLISGTSVRRGILGGRYDKTTKK